MRCIYAFAVRREDRTDRRGCHRDLLLGAGVACYHRRHCLAADMMRLAIIAALFVAAAGVGLWLYSRGADNARADQLERTLEDAQKANKGAADAAACDWYEWLSEGCDTGN